MAVSLSRISRLGPLLRVRLREVGAAAPTRFLFSSSLARNMHPRNYANYTAYRLSYRSARPLLSLFLSSPATSSSSLFSRPSALTRSLSRAQRRREDAATKRRSYANRLTVHPRAASASFPLLPPPPFLLDVRPILADKYSPCLSLARSRAVPRRVSFCPPRLPSANASAGDHCSGVVKIMNFLIRRNSSARPQPLDTCKIHCYRDMRPLLRMGNIMKM